MNLSNLLSAIAISLLAATGATHAETYEGVHPLTNGMLRSDVAREAVAAARADNPYAEASNAGPARPIVNGLRRESVRAEAVAAARIGNLYSEAASAGTVALPGSARERQRSNKKSGERGVAEPGYFEAARYSARVCANRRVRPSRASILGVGVPARSPSS